MQFHGADLRCRNQRFDPVKLQVGFAIAPDRHLSDQGRLALSGMALEELFFALDPGRHANHRARPTFDVPDQPVADVFVVAG